MTDALNLWFHWLRGIDVNRGFPRRVFLCNLWCSWERYLHQLPPPHFAPLFINALPWNDIYNRHHFACPSVRPPIEWKCAVPVPKLSAFVLMTSPPSLSSVLPSFLPFASHFHQLLRMKWCLSWWTAFSRLYSPIVRHMESQRSEKP